MSGEWNVVTSHLSDVMDNFALSEGLKIKLIEKGLVSYDDLQDVTAERTDYQQKFTLILKYMAKRGSGSLELFRQALEESSYEYLASQLREWSLQPHGSIPQPPSFPSRRPRAQQPMYGPGPAFAQRQQLPQHYYAPVPVPGYPVGQQPPPPYGYYMPEQQQQPFYSPQDSIPRPPPPPKHDLPPDGAPVSKYIKLNLAVSTVGNSKWRKIGELLGFRFFDLDDIESTFGLRTDSDRLNRTIDAWVADKGLKATVGELCKACETAGISRDMIREEYSRLLD